MNEILISILGILVKETIKVLSIW